MSELKANKISPNVASYYSKLGDALKVGDQEKVIKLISDRKDAIERAMTNRTAEYFSKEIPTEGNLTIESRSKTPFDPGDFDLDINK